MFSYESYFMIFFTLNAGLGCCISDGEAILKTELAQTITAVGGPVFVRKPYEIWGTAYLQFIVKVVANRYYRTELPMSYCSETCLNCPDLHVESNFMCK